MSTAHLRHQIQALASGSITERCAALGLARSSFYYQPRGETATNLALMRLLDEEYTRHCFLGVRGLHLWLRQQGHEVNVKRVRRLCRLMGLEAICPKPDLSRPGVPAVRFPYLLRNEPIVAPNHVWSTDITYIPLAKGFLYLVAVIDWHSRFVLSWELSNSMEVEFCLRALQDALLRYGRPQIFNTDQGSQFTSKEFVSALQAASCQISWDGKGRATDNAFIERLWRSVKYECLYLHPADDGRQVFAQLEAYFAWYNYHRPHQGLNGQTPASIYLATSTKATSTIQ